ncbi:hypothetical protein EXIGLDRAFT_490114 [Exidia glandulosa HHB12029]|uniref:Uncharacterized protein n=1 Tax=Exidia glandulosa HHB12029 TaxID=1314781 RepID=A0A165JMM8_EXIGL|nr:hypothetical protein EXIGLDRAFT_490114 [Exidia glandulosa HHB12029]
MEPGNLVSLRQPHRASVFLPCPSYRPSWARSYCALPVRPHHDFVRSFLRTGRRVSAAPRYGLTFGPSRGRVPWVRLHSFAVSALAGVMRTQPCQRGITSRAHSRAIGLGPRCNVR